MTDAASGTVLASAEHVKSAQGNSLHSGRVTIGSTPQADGTYALIDPERGGHRTLDSSVDSRGVLFTDHDDVWGDGTPSDPQTAAVDAAYGARMTWDFFKDRFGRNGIADDGRGSTSRVHYEQSRGVPLANANWQDGCFCMSYGDGADGQHPVTSLDIAAHEMTHGVTSATAGLGDFGESPGLNEAISDMMAAAVEFYADNPTTCPTTWWPSWTTCTATASPSATWTVPRRPASAPSVTRPWTTGRRKPGGKRRTWWPG